MCVGRSGDMLKLAAAHGHVGSEFGHSHNQSKEVRSLAVTITRKRHIFAKNIKTMVVAMNKRVVCCGEDLNYVLGSSPSN